jgi:opacity protein-like surface antigen
MLAAAATLTLTAPACAADLAVKALPIAYAPCTLPTASTPLSCSGFYVGGGVAGAGSNADIIGSGINGSVFAGGITPTVDAGYQYVQGNWVFGAEFDAGYSFKTGADVNGVGNGFNGFRIEEDFKVGGNISGLLGTQSPITIPASLANSVLAPYVHVGAAQWQLPGSWANGNISGAGLLFDISPRIFGDIRYTYTNFNGARAGGVTINNDQSIKVLINYKLD